MGYSELECHDGVIVTKVTHRLPVAATIIDTGIDSQTIQMRVEFTSQTRVGPHMTDEELRAALCDASRKLATQLRETADRCDAFLPLTPKKVPTP